MGVIRRAGLDVTFACLSLSSWAVSAINTRHFFALPSLAGPAGFPEVPMSRVCQVTGKRPMTGNNVSHANNKTRRRFLPNLQNHRFWVESERRWVTLRVSGHGMRIIDKRGIDAVLADLRSRGEKV